MTALDTAFAATGLVAVVGGLLAVTTRHVVHAALWLVVALLGVAGSLLVLGAELVALVLVLVYVGAVVVLVLFALMLTRAPIGPDLEHQAGPWRTAGSAALGAAVAVLLGSVLLPLTGGAVERAEVDEHPGRGPDLRHVGLAVRAAVPAPPRRARRRRSPSRASPARRPRDPPHAARTSWRRRWSVSVRSGSRSGATPCSSSSASSSC